jgi:2-polyprenyl-3-methyl-5-hydroxy-6-metoxy-1,4-benzoquinol methylase
MEETNMNTQAFDDGKAEAFGGKMTDILNYSFLGYMCSIGHQTGLFDAMSGLAATTSEGIADATGLNERYVREWLGGMVAGGIVEYDPGTAAYTLPQEHAQFLTRASGPDNMAFYASYLAIVGEIEQQVVDSFRNGGGVPYSAYPRFQTIQAEESAMLFDTALVETVMPLLPGGVDALEAGIRVADIGCGQGHALNLLAKAFPNSHFVGYDLSEEGIAAARQEAAALGLINASFEIRNVSDLGTAASYDLITAFDTIHDLAQPGKALKSIADTLRPGGLFFMGEFAASSNLEENLDTPMASMLYGFSLCYCMTTSLATGGEGVGTMWGEQTARKYLQEAGFADVEVKQVEGDPLHNYFTAKRQ